MDYLTRDQIQAVDDLAVASGMSIMQMMENAGRSLAAFCAKLNPKKVSIVYGKGNNGGGGLAAARFLKLKGIKIEIIAASANNNHIVKQQLKLLNINHSDNITGDVVIDALLGYNIKGDPRDDYAKLIEKMNSSDSKIVSLDLPSGIDPNKGEIYTPFVKSDYILSLALPKLAHKNFDNVYLVNIGIPNYIYEELHLEPAIFVKDIIKI